jgi:hypothetical protein
MDTVAQKLDARLAKWNPKLSEEVRTMVTEIIEWADSDAQDLMRSRVAEQEVLDLLDEPTSR